MSIKKCKECGGELSTKAEACPHCGAKQPKRTSAGTWLILGLIILAVAASCGREKRPAPEPISVSKPARQESATHVAAPNWIAGQYSDAMTDEVMRTLAAASENTAVFERPYRVPGGSRLYLIFRKGADGALDAYLRIDEGQMQCSSLSCNFSLRVGDGEVQRWTGLETSTNRSDTMFVRDAEQLQAIVSRGGKIRIGIEFYRQGTHAFEFDVSDYPGF